MRTLTYEIPGMMTVETAALNMIELVGAESKRKSDEDVRVVAVHNGIEFSAGRNSRWTDLVEEWSEKRRQREIQEQRIHPVRVAVNYLLRTLSDSDRLILVKEIASDPLSKEGE
jgi:hypothetical protein